MKNLTKWKSLWGLVLILAFFSSAWPNDLGPKVIGCLPDGTKRILLDVPWLSLKMEELFTRRATGWRT